MIEILHAAYTVRNANVRLNVVWRYTGKRYEDIQVYYTGKRVLDCVRFDLD